MVLNQEIKYTDLFLNPCMLHLLLLQEGHPNGLFI